MLLKALQPSIQHQQLYINCSNTRANSKTVTVGQVDSSSLTDFSWWDMFLWIPRHVLFVVWFVYFCGVGAELSCQQRTTWLLSLPFNEMCAANDPLSVALPLHYFPCRISNALFRSHYQGSSPHFKGELSLLLILLPLSLNSDMAALTATTQLQATLPTPFFLFLSQNSLMSFINFS